MLFSVNYSYAAPFPEYGTQISHAENANALDFRQGRRREQGLGY